jgi:hypothetical protein
VPKTFAEVDLAVLAVLNRCTWLTAYALVSLASPV